MSLRTTWLTRLFIAIPVVVFASCLAAVSANSSSPQERAGVDGPSNFDYLVLASIADSPNLAAMAGYRSAAGQCSESGAHPTEN
jgi:hypothetical protein